MNEVSRTFDQDLRFLLPDWIFVKSDAFETEHFGSADYADRLEMFRFERITFYFG